MNIIFLSSIQDMYIEFSDLDFHLVIAIYFWEKKIDLVYLWKRFAPHCNYIDKWHQHWQQFQFSNTQNFLSTTSNRERIVKKKKNLE